MPVLCGFAIGGSSPAGWLFLAAWLCAYPVGYYAGRAVTVRVRRGAWTRLARRELGRAVPWIVLTAALGLPLAWTRPWLLLAAVLMSGIWAMGLWAADRWGERSLANDLVLVAQAVLALPLTVAVVAGPTELGASLRGVTATCTALIALYLTGSVLHVKSLLRESGNVAFHRLNLGWHLGAVVLATLVDPWWLIGFGPALVRAIAMRPGMRPAAIGAVEAVVSVLIVVAAFLAV